ncbi:RagB/SusD family nutrient uptake outer membrane protein [Flavobacteriaceae bacterium F08102]|nr:RagB/SusD family nutrient uptake outer membrane protein [Flavobacteriaceae bacterium F08102]
MKIRLYIYTLIVSIGLVSCNDYLDVDPIGRLIPTKIDEFDRLLIGGDYSIHTTSDDNALFLSADNTDALVNFLGDISSPDNLPIRFLKWEADLFPPNATIALWNNPYKNIYTYNFITANIDEALGSDENARKRIKAEARTMRAYEYFILVNSFAKQYDAATANTDPGVPLVTIPDVLAESTGRASVQEIYDFMLTEVIESIADLPVSQSIDTRATKGAGYGFLARIYLQMNDYVKAREYANLALGQNGTISDYTSGNPLGTLYDAEQYTYRYFGGTYGYTGGTLTDEVLSLFDINNDVRVNGIYGYLSYRNGYAKGYSTYSNHFVSIPEMYLIRAEANARLDDATIDDVLDDLNELRRNRIYGYTDSTNVASKEAALLFVLEERRREMLATGMRWFDLKRLNQETATAKTITHTIDVDTYTLAPNSNRYVFPIPPETMNFNPDMEQNPRN